MKKLFLKNAGLKVSAILISVLLWFFVTSRGQSEMSFEIPVEFKNIPVGLGIAGASAKSVNVTIKGQERLMKSVKSSDIRVFVDLGTAKKGETSCRIGNDDVKLPYVMAVTHVDPSTIRVRLDETVAKMVRVKPVISGMPENGYFVKSVEVEPKSVLVHGLKSELRKITGVKTDTMDISGMKETTTEELNLDAMGASLRPEEATVRVTVVIGGKSG
jgi:YbbR domain-containing protein